MIIIVVEKGKFGVLIIERTSKNSRDGGRAKLGSSSTHSDAFARRNKQTRPRETGIPPFFFLPLGKSQEMYFYQERILAERI